MRKLLIASAATLPILLTGCAETIAFGAGSMAGWIGNEYFSDREEMQDNQQAQTRANNQKMSDDMVADRNIQPNQPQQQAYYQAAPTNPVQSRQLESKQANSQNESSFFDSLPAFSKPMKPRDLSEFAPDTSGFFGDDEPQAAKVPPRYKGKNSQTSEQLRIQPTSQVMPQPYTPSQYRSQQMQQLQQQQQVPQAHYNAPQQQDYQPMPTAYGMQPQQPMQMQQQPPMQPTAYYAPQSPQPQMQQQSYQWGYYSAQPAAQPQSYAPQQGMMAPTAPPMGFAPQQGYASQQPYAPAQQAYAPYPSNASANDGYAQPNQQFYGY